MLPIIFRLPVKGDLQIDCVVDTGFSESIALPPAAIAAMGLPFIEDRRVNLANDTYTDLGVYSGAILWQGTETPIRVFASGRLPLVGVEVLYGNLLGIDFVENGIVTARPRS